MGDVVPIWERSMRNHPSSQSLGPLIERAQGEWWIRRADGKFVFEDFEWASGGTDPSEIDWVAVEESYEDFEEEVVFVAEWMLPTSTVRLVCGVPCEPDPYVVEEPGEFRCRVCDGLWAESDYEVGSAPICEPREEKA